MSYLSPTSLEPEGATKLDAEVRGSHLHACLVCQRHRDGLDFTNLWPDSRVPPLTWLAPPHPAVYQHPAILLTRRVARAETNQRTPGCPPSLLPAVTPPTTHPHAIAVRHPPLVPSVSTLCLPGPVFAPSSFDALTCDLPTPSVFHRPAATDLIDTRFALCAQPLLSFLVSPTLAAPAISCSDRCQTKCSNTGHTGSTTPLYPKYNRTLAPVRKPARSAGHQRPGPGGHG